ncbi:MAG TPA: nickel insertion protein, partial [Nitriliruptorales bacterium]
GAVETAHGRVPVPSPAVTALLRGFPVRGGADGVELTTATGAALVAELATPTPVLPDMTLIQVGIGAGAADLASPNVLRTFLGDASEGPPADQHTELPGRPSDG